MANRIRNERIEIKLTKEEKKLFKKKMKISNSKNMAHFIRKCVMEKEIYIVDLEPFRNIQWLLSNATNNINQIAKHANQTGVIYKNDIKSMRKDIDEVSKAVWQIHSLLLNRTTEGDD
ncbi:plasmid mobilization relaxosome protein MobC [Enterococcus asini]|uniref:plasmid mobilization protein n=1 Tax=Enterococcus asini TaxID=57732 RepID=UPI002891F378|nr:plasmid mobilization relaxosome protein MobC [Enterococcus asini]MDT2758082.1 plasmid mobilization relaxosome protein MobC [Enterococcus asini]